ncbi:hypothetical protein C8R43DRAFT_954069 [Mycena crocata]|nr:hypothetical protein C8R43DRAFT_954069 [Mycena crocata]
MHRRHASAVKAQKFKRQMRIRYSECNLMYPPTSSHVRRKRKQFLASNFEDAEFILSDVYSTASTKLQFNFDIGFLESCFVVGATSQLLEATSAELPYIVDLEVPNDLESTCHPCLTSSLFNGFRKIDSYRRVITDAESHHRVAARNSQLFGAVWRDSSSHHVRESRNTRFKESNGREIGRGEIVSRNEEQTPPKTDPDFEPGEFYTVKPPSSLLTRIQTMSDTSKEYMGAAVQKSAQEFVAAGDILRAWAADTTSTATRSARLEAACNKYAKGGDAYAQAGAIFEVGERAAFCRDASGNAYMESFKAKRDAKDCEKMDLD